MKTPIFDFLKGLADRVTSKAHQVQGRVQAAANHIQPAAQPQALAVQQPQEQPDMVLTPEQLTQIARMVTQTLAPVIKAQVQREVAASLAAQPQPADQSAIIAQLVEKLHQSTPTPAPVTPPAPAVELPPVIVAAPYSPPANIVTVTAPNGATRTYPAQLPTDVNLFTYVSRVAQIINPATGQPYYPPGAVAVATQFPSHGRTWPDCVDEMTHPDDWDGGRGARIRQEQAQHFATAVATGPFNPDALTDDDLYYINRHASEMTFDPRQLMSGQFYGPSVAKTGSQKYGDGSAMYNVIANESKVNPAVVKALREMAGRTVLPWMVQAFPEFGSPRWAAEHVTAWYNGWKRLHGGQEP